ncbi:hypothetical protein AHF37_11742 [Paragonimus kellicotti]|nr:hypothetical protein AHF37_11742 [Paragonimus kellicotti]
MNLKNYSYMRFKRTRDDQIACGMPLNVPALIDNWN